jgi:phage anti-repressor protein
MMEEKQAREEVNTVNARDLHKGLMVGKDFSTWISGRIRECKFELNVGYVRFTPNLGKTSGGRPSIEYHLALDAAKHFAMMERNEQGKKIRQYFEAVLAPGQLWEITMNPENRALWKWSWAQQKGRIVC